MYLQDSLLLLYSFFLPLSFFLVCIAQEARRLLCEFIPMISKVAKSGSSRHSCFGQLFRPLSPCSKRSFRARFTACRTFSCVIALKLLLLFNSTLAFTVMFVPQCPLVVYVLHFLTLSAWNFAPSVSSVPVKAVSHSRKPKLLLYLLYIEMSVERSQKLVKCCCLTLSV